MSDDYEPEPYWSSRLDAKKGLRSTGHLQYTERYNEWIYRRKGEALRRALRPLLPRRHALDVGSGVGWVVEALHRSGVSAVEGCDLAPSAVDRLKARFPNDSFFVAGIGADRLPVEDGRYDLITMLDVSYHIVDDDLWEEGLREMARVAAPGGGLVLIDKFGPETVAPSAHVRFRSLDLWTRALSASGWEVPQPPVPVYRWLSRPKDASLLRLLPDRLRGPVEYAAEHVAPVGGPHIRCLTVRRSSGA